MIRGRICVGGSDTITRHSHVFAERITGGGANDRDDQLNLKPYAAKRGWWA